MSSFEHLSFEERVAARRRCHEVEGLHAAFLAANVEYREVLHEFLQAALLHKPADPLAFMAEYFAAHREKRAAYKCK